MYGHRGSGPRSSGPAGVCLIPLLESGPQEESQ